MSITIQEISGTRGLKKFAKFPINLYKGNEYYVPALVLDEVGTLNSKNNPAFDFCESVYYMAYKDGEPVGRIAGIINHKANEKSGEKAGRFGFVDFIDDKQSAFQCRRKVGKIKRHDRNTRAARFYRHGSRRNTRRRVRPTKHDVCHLQLSILPATHRKHGLRKSDRLGGIQNKSTRMRTRKTSTH